jgi:hypothetical protein
LDIVGVREIGHDGRLWVALHSMIRL